MVKLPTTVEEAPEMKPLVRVERPVIPRVELNTPAPVTVNAPTLVEEAFDIYPEVKVWS